MFLPLRPNMRTSSPRRSAITRTPSYLISNTQPARENGCSARVAIGGLVVRLLPQQPVVVAAAGADQVPTPAELVPEQLELELAARVLLADVLGLERAIGAAIPHDHGAGAVVAGRDHAFEVRILERMVLDVHRETLLLGAHRGALRHRPALEHALHLETEVTVE